MLNWSQPGVVEVPTITDELGSLGVVEGDAPFPFPIRRVYFIHSVTPGAVRGSHAHKALRQLIVAVSGSFTVTLDDGSSESTWPLDTPTKGLVVPPGYWRTLSGFTTGAAALVFASEEYDPDDYIRDYDAFVAWARHG
ncbi:MAG TPA: FdtA/QdtA family cupin domain-containing protein [Microbacteriaceae bacterium]|nr:FdtA/QdtA family cupin domain-containing protein [Microbacteriaceae bacterium]